MLESVAWSAGDARTFDVVAPSAARRGGAGFHGQFAIMRDEKDMTNAIFDLIEDFQSGQQEIMSFGRIGPTSRDVNRVDFGLRSAMGVNRRAVSWRIGSREDAGTLSPCNSIF